MGIPLCLFTLSVVYMLIYRVTRNSAELILRFSLTIIEKAGPRSLLKNLFSFIFAYRIARLIFNSSWRMMSKGVLSVDLMWEFRFPVSWWNFKLLGKLRFKAWLGREPFHVSYG